mmetsp:Transcript_30872/g.61125  ORF Transcript_30872/g.61125 Transcript_30872/m.61125 type:complete len:319 (+) Transcript_30872:81-1037(+)
MEHSIRSPISIPSPPRHLASAITIFLLALPHAISFSTVALPRAVLFSGYGATAPRRHIPDLRGPVVVGRIRLASSPDGGDSADPLPGHGIDVNENPALYGLTIPRAPGVEWGTDLSFAFVYVREVDPSGPAAAAGVLKGDQLCAVGDTNVIGLPFDQVMTALVSLSGRTMDVVMFRGTKDDLIAACANADEYSGNGKADTITITAIVGLGKGKGGKEEKEVRTFVVPKGSNVREVLAENDINVYQSLTRWTNCSGKQLCGTCIVNISEGSAGTSRKTLDEESTLRDNPDSYRLSCVTFAYSDITVETFPPIEAYQWTR